MRTCAIEKNKIDVAMAALGLLTALLLLGGCATNSTSPTMTALTSVRQGPHEPITRVAFNAIDPYAPRLQNIETASGSAGSR